MALDNTTDSTYINVLWLDIKNLQKSATRETFHVKRGERVDWTRLFSDFLPAAKRLGLTGLFKEFATL